MLSSWWWWWWSEATRI